MLRTCRTPLLAAFALLGAALARPALAQGFTVTDLGTLGGTTSHAFAISQQSHIVGSATTSGGATHAFFFNGTISDLGTLPGGTTSAAFGLNGIDQAAGQATTSGGAQHAVLFEGGSLFDLGTFGGATSIANAINNNGASVGGALNAGGAMHAFLHTGTGALAGGDDLGTLGGANSQAFALNDSNVVGGQSDTATAGVSHGFLWDSVNLMQDVGTLGGSNSAVLGLNGVGQASGLANTASGAQHAFFLDSGVMTDLGTLGGTNSQGNAINNNEQVVGQSDTSTSGVQHAFVWDPTNGMVDLNTLLPTGSGWVLTSATGIDDAGEIVGFGSIGGNVHAFLLQPIRATVTLNPDPVFGGQHSTLTVTLPNPAPSGGTYVSLTSSNGGLAVFANNGSSSSSMTIPAGAVSATTILNTAVVGSSQNVTISVTPSGQPTVNSTLTLTPLLRSITLKPSTVVGSQNSTLIVNLAVNAPPGGMIVNLTSSNGGLAVFANNGSSSSSIAIGAGSKSGQVVINTGAVNASTGVNIAAGLAGLTITKTLTLTPWLQSLTLTPTSVVGGSMQCTGTVTLFAPSATGGVTVSLSSSDGNKAVFDNNGSSSSSVVVPKGAKSTTFVIDTFAVKAKTTVTIKTSLGNLTLQQTLTITPWLKSLAINPKIVIGGCQHTTGTINLFAPAPPGGVTVNLSSNDGGTAWFDNNGSSSSSVVVPKGALSVIFVIDTQFVGVNKTPSITASLAGLSKTFKITVTPALSGVSLRPSTVIGGCQTSTATVTLLAQAPPGGVTVNLSSNSGLAVFDNNGSTSSGVTVVGGATSASFVIDTGFVGSNTNVTISSSFNGGSKATVLTLTPALISFTLNTNTVNRGGRVTGTVTLADAALSGVTVNLSSSNGGLAWFDNNGSSSSSVTIPGGATSATFVIDVSSSNTGQVTISTT